MKAKYDWIRFDGERFICKRCGRFDWVAVRMPINAWLAWSENFIAEHKNCSLNAGGVLRPIEVQPG